MVIGNEHTSDRSWLGEIHLIAIYGRALSPAEVTQNFRAGVAAKVDYASLLPPATKEPVEFVRDVQPIFRKHCFECHAQGNEEGGLNLGIRARAMAGGDSGKAIVRDNSAQSLLVHLVAGVEQDRIMPPDGEGEPLSRDEIGIVRAWIDQGAIWPQGADVLDPRTERAREHWAFQPLHSIAPPEVANAAWVQTPIDRFVLAKLSENKLTPTAPLSAKANSAAVLRRHRPAANSR